MHFVKLEEFKCEITKIVYVISELNNYTNITIIKYKNKCLLNTKKTIYYSSIFTTKTSILFRRSNFNMKINR